MPETARRYGLTNPHDPAESIDAAARYIRDSTLRFGNRYDLILAAYNAGEGAVDAYLKGSALRLNDNRVINPRGLKLGGIPPYNETRNYVARGMKIVHLLSAAPQHEQAHNVIRSSPVSNRYNAPNFALMTQQVKAIPKSLYTNTPHSNSMSLRLTHTINRETKTHSFRIAALTSEGR